MSNYPDGMDWAAYDEYQDPKLECGHYASDSCDCWCPEPFMNRGHMVGDCNSDNCKLYRCKDCDEPVDEINTLCKECIAERGCQCIDGNRRVWVHCLIGVSHPAPATFSVEKKYLYTHWTFTPTNVSIEKRRETYVEKVTCSVCFLEVDV